MFSTSQMTLQLVDSTSDIPGILTNSSDSVDIKTSVNWRNLNLEVRIFAPNWTFRPVLPSRLFRKISIDAQTGCWIWTGSTGFHPQYRHHRYSQIAVYDRATRTKYCTTAHRFAYICTFGEIPAEFDVDHKCQNKLCVNPSHLEAVSHQENIRRIPAESRARLIAGVKIAATKRRAAKLRRSS